MNAEPLFSQKPKGMDEHAWYRSLEPTLVLTVISADEEPDRCQDCGFTATRFQCQLYPSRAIVALCKLCALKRAGDPPQLWVRTEKPLRTKWLRNGKDPARQEQSRKAYAKRRADGRAAGVETASDAE